MVVSQDEVLGLQRALHGVAEQAQIIDTRPYEWEARAQIGDELVPRLHGALNDAVALLGRLLERYESVPQGRGPEDSGAFDLQFEQLVEPTTQSPDLWRRVADVSFMARWELRRKQRALRKAMGANDEHPLLSECCSVRRRVLKAISGVERVLAEVEGYPSVFEGLYRTERQRAIATRLAYLSFASGRRIPAGDQTPLLRSIRLAGIDLARLIGRDVYQDLWVDDRLRIRELQRRLLAWLRAPHDPLDGERLLSDLQAFGELLMEVNRRPVLIEHDREVLHRMLPLLAMPAPDEDVMFDALGSVRGRDRELDVLIQARAPLRPESWGPTLERVLGGLSPNDPA